MFRSTAASSQTTAGPRDSRWTFIPRRGLLHATVGSPLPPRDSESAVAFDAACSMSDATARRPRCPAESNASRTRGWWRARVRCRTARTASNKQPAHAECLTVGGEDMRVRYLIRRSPPRTARRDRQVAPRSAILRSVPYQGGAVQGDQRGTLARGTLGNRYRRSCVRPASRQQPTDVWDQWSGAHGDRSTPWRSRRRHGADGAGQDRLRGLLVVALGDTSPDRTAGGLDKSLRTV